MAINEFEGSMGSGMTRVNCI